MNVHRYKLIQGLAAHSMDRGNGGNLHHSVIDSMAHNAIMVSSASGGNNGGINAHANNGHNGGAPNQERSIIMGSINSHANNSRVQHAFVQEPLLTYVGPPSPVEKKRRRDVGCLNNEGRENSMHNMNVDQNEETSTICNTEHFLLAGTGSQACQGQ